MSLGNQKAKTGNENVKRGDYTIETISDTLLRARPQNTRVIIPVAGADKNLIKPDTLVLIDKSGAAIKPVFCENRKVGHEENTKVAT